MVFRAPFLSLRPPAPRVSRGLSYPVPDFPLPGFPNALHRLPLSLVPGLPCALPPLQTADRKTPPKTMLRIFLARPGLAEVRRKRSSEASPSACGLVTGWGCARPSSRVRREQVELLPDDASSVINLPIFQFIALRIPQQPALPAYPLPCCQPAQPAIS